MDTTIRRIANNTNTNMVFVRSDVPRAGNSDHRVVHAKGSQTSDWNVPWSTEEAARKLLQDPSGNGGNGIKIITGSHIWVIWQEKPVGGADALWIIEHGKTKAETSPRNAVGGDIAIEVEASGSPCVKDHP
jgi:hypothetical protein